MASPLKAFSFAPDACPAAFDHLDKDIKERLVHAEQWPGIDDYNSLFSQAPLAFTMQDDKAVKAAGGYEAYIETHKLIPTRLHNIHDLMNAWTWHSFPRSKSALHQLQCSDGHHQQRSPRQNACTLFDECGMLLISANSAYFKLIQSHQWQKLFWQKRKDLKHDCRFMVFGHALLEKCLNPYIGICGQLLWIHADKATTLEEIDVLVSDVLQVYLNDTTVLHPLPLLGIPGWHAQNNDAAFYQNTDYFRP